jgi:ABC-type bacteriocin/lantibiotic exporter with double-glycine peptidase domain
VAWQQVKSLATGANEPPAEPPPSNTPVHAQNVSYAYSGRDVLTGVSLDIRPGDRVLLQGPSGAGKSTLAAVLAGLRVPTAGAVSGASGVVIAPQFHEDHLISASLAFNLLLGNRWPAAPDDLRQAWEICVELGLGPVLERMPAGLEQPVGEVGWQLSHGERSRIYVARALLSGGGTVVLDESFAALDPAALEQTLRCVLKRASALVVIAHE